MCGKFTAMMTWAEYAGLAGVSTSGSRDGSPDAMDPGKLLGTFTPMSTVPIVHLGPVRQRRITPMRWGWYDHKAANPFRSFKHLHARSDTIDTLPTWIESLQERRGVIFAKQFNIGEELPSEKTKQWICSRADGEPVAIAVIFNTWELLQGPLRAFAMVTTASCQPRAAKDERMPALLRDEDEVAAWLGEIGAPDAELKALLRPYDGSLVMREQDSPKKDGPPPKPKNPKPEPQPGMF
ncbi:MAG TPA: SOS response-associated peptidase family protein [Xanthobacteraceae bacterium]|jgi:putative SOS response-associated peptidase YedK